MPPSNSSTHAPLAGHDEEFPLYVLRDYAMAADGERAMLIGPRGDVVWMCAPRWDSDAVFSLLIGGGGAYAVTPVDHPFVWGGQYEPGTLIWHSRWVTTSQAIECHEALAFPGDPRTAVILRRIDALDGAASVRVVLDPRAGFGRYKMSRVKEKDGVWTARCGPLYLRWSGGGAATRRPDGSLAMTVSVEAGDHHDLVLEISDVALPPEPVDAARAWAGTREAWASVVPRVTDTIADHDAWQSAAVLRGLTSSGGGMVAGATMSLPERYGGERNYDYRYAWIRDQCYAGQAAAVSGQFALLDDAVRFVAERLLEDGEQLKPAYTVVGAPVPDERSLKLTGYPGGTDKVGNWVNHQFQLDAFGEALLLFAAAAAIDRLDRDHWRAAEVAVAVIEKRRHDPDAGIWELDDDEWTHSRLSCVAGLRAIAIHAPAAQGGRWSGLADSILAETTASSLHSSGRWKRSPRDDRLDSALLFPAVRGALPADDPRTQATLAAALEELGQDCYMYRFQQDDQPLGDTEGAFLLCGFMTSLALHQQGREVDAVRWFERNRAACGTPGLFAEEFDVGQRQLRGNLPQAFVHALLLETAHRLADPR
jgi:GH15 family glucan-1,4-alpha-glucosidase